MLRKHALKTGRRYFCSDPTKFNDSFINKVKKAGANVLLGIYPYTSGFDSKMKGLKCESIGDGYVKCSLKVTSDVQNSYGTLHGGAIATLIDIVGTMSVLSVKPTNPGLSLEINTSYIGIAKTGDNVIIEANLIKIGKNIAFTEVNIKNENGKPIAAGRHTKYIGSN